MKFKIKVKNSRTSWEEEYVENLASEDEIDIFASGLIANYNATLRPGEEPREYLDYKVIDKDLKNHNWEKQNYFTKIDRNGCQYDEYKCTRCGITGKRFTLDGNIVPNKQFKAKKYKYCT